MRRLLVGISEKDGLDERGYRYVWMKGTIRGDMSRTRSHNVWKYYCGQSIVHRAWKNHRWAKRVEKALCSSYRSCKAHPRAKFALFRAVDSN
jgi:hypothetical protein